jgi:signal transduction histidine kinase
MPNGGPLKVTAERIGQAARIQVADAGEGIPPDVRDKIYNLYFTTKKSGSGIGLAMTYRVMQLHNGALDFESEPGQGTTFRMLLPVADGVQPETSHLSGTTSS